MSFGIQTYLNTPNRAKTVSEPIYQGSATVSGDPTAENLMAWAVMMGGEEGESWTLLVHNQGEGQAPLMFVVTL